MQKNKQLAETKESKEIAIQKKVDEKSKMRKEVINLENELDINEMKINSLETDKQVILEKQINL